MARADARARAARVIGVDLTTATVVRSLRAAGIRSILLKGPGLAAVLYGPGEIRQYVDADLLVAQENLTPAAAVLRDLGFEQLVDDAALRGHRPVHAHEWKSTNGASVDLHRTLPGAGAPPTIVYAVLAAHTRPIIVAGETVEALSPEAALVQVALHCAHHGPRASKALHDLERAVDRVPAETWTEAADLAERLEATPAFAAGLRLSAGGTTLADRLSLPHTAPVEVTLRAGGAPPLAVGLYWLLHTPGMRRKAVLAGRTVFPPAAALRLWRPRARRGRAGLLAAYASHPFWLARHAVPSLLAMRRARRATG
jgi:hypothetical protein